MENDFFRQKEAGDATSLKYTKTAVNRMKLYHFLNQKYGFEAIERKRIKIARINHLNDPFEYFHLDTDNCGTRTILKKRRSRASKRHGIVCFSESYKSPVQWAHYGDSHRGICLGFEVNDKNLLKIEYTDQRTPGDAFKDSLDLKWGEFLRFMLSIKHEHWSYEQEQRLIVNFKEPTPEDEIQFKTFSENLELKEVILGFNSSLSSKKIRKMCRDYGLDVEVSKVSPSNKKYIMEKTDF